MLNCGFCRSNSISSYTTKKVNSLNLWLSCVTCQQRFWSAYRIWLMIFLTLSCTRSSRSIYTWWIWGGLQHSKAHKTVGRMQAPTADGIGYYHQRFKEQLRICHPRCNYKNRKKLKKYSPAISGVGCLCPPPLNWITLDFTNKHLFLKYYIFNLYILI